MHTLKADSLKSKIGREKAIFKIVEALRSDEIVIAPIDQGYAYIADPNSELAMTIIKELKGMSASHFFALLINNVEQIKDYCGSISSEQRLLAKEFWPGPLMLECDVLPGLRGSFGSDGTPESLFFKQAANETLKGVCEMSGPVVFSPIVDKAKNSITELRKVSSEAKKIVKYAIESKSRWSKKVTTVVSFHQSSVEITRRGDISEQQVRKIVPKVIAS